MKDVLLVTAPWCQVCHSMTPWWKELNSISGIDARIVDVADEEVEMMGIWGLPTILICQHGEVLYKKAGVKSKAEVEKLIKEVCS